jgi:hypothetical protein
MNAAVPEPSLSALARLLPEPTLLAGGVFYPQETLDLIPMTVEGRPGFEGVRA